VIKKEEKKTLGEILLVEDNPGDVRLVVETLLQEDFQYNLHVTRDGVEALEFLRHTGKFSNSPRPNLILLDLNLPKKNGIEVLAEIKIDENLRRIPVIILTASQSQDDISTAYNSYANCYLVKPLDLDQFYMLVDAIRDFWLTKATLAEK
jgi:two-component system, chemotaxis family, response regulator Rcp1